MKKNININRIISALLILPFIAVNLGINTVSASADKIVYPLKEVSKLSCRYQDFKDLGSNCKQSLPILKSKDYSKYIKLNWGYNEYTRYYTVLWWASYKYGWDVWFWGHEWTDFATAKWTPIYSIADGIVIVSKNALGWGNVVTIKHNIRWKNVYSNYAHMSKIIVKKWQKVKAWTKIWEVGSTWNSSGNHLHLQIDLETAFHPFYFSRKTCPYSYNDITEKWVCFDELAENTIDPLVFLETKWAILDNIKTNKVKVSRSEFNTTSVKKTTVKKSSTTKINTNNSAKKSWDDFINIFNKTVYNGYSKEDIKDVQRVFKTLGYYKWTIDWNYSKLEKNVIEYQINRKIISSKHDVWAGRFGPKTRAQAKKDYLKIVWKKWQINTSFKKQVSSSLNTKKQVQNTTKRKIQKIERKNILTRAEIEKREIDDFLRTYKIDLKLSKIWWNINLGSSMNLIIEIKNKRNNRYFRWNTPLNITFPVNNSNIKVFPTKLYNFSDWKRTAKITWIKEWNSTLKVKLWNRILKSFNIKVLKAWKQIYPKSARLFSSSKIVLWDTKKWIIVLKDSNNKNLINLRYGSSYKLKANADALICLKSWSIKDIKRIYKSKCKQTDFKNEISFDYNSTVWGLILFEYKAVWLNPRIELVNNYKNISLVNKRISVSLPKDIKSNYVYKDDVLSMLKENIVNWVNKWYFLQNRDLTNGDALVWIENTLIKLKANTYDSNVKQKIDSKLKELKRERLMKYKAISRKWFLELSYKYLNLGLNKWYVAKNYRDLNSDLNKKAWVVFWNNVTWKDDFWKNYFRPDSHITRWEAAFMLNQTYKNNKSIFLTLK